MKKLLTVLVLAVGFTVTTHAQKANNNKRQQLTVEQQTDLAVKKMTLKLDLNEAQQSQIKPLIAEKIAERKKMSAKRKAMKDSKNKPTADERYEMESKMLDKQIAFKKEMKHILNEDQYKRFEKMAAKKMKKHKKIGKRIKKRKKYENTK